MQASELLDKSREELKEKLDVSEEVIEKAKEILSRLHGTRMHPGSGMHPKSIAGGAVYIAGVLLGERKTQREIALAFGVAAATIRKSCKKIAAEENLEITV